MPLHKLKHLKHTYRRNQSNARVHAHNAACITMVAPCKFYTSTILGCVGLASKINRIQVNEINRYTRYNVAMHYLVITRKRKHKPSYKVSLSLSPSCFHPLFYQNRSTKSFRYPRKKI